jgi:hypothetical protein
VTTRALMTAKALVVIGAVVLVASAVPVTPGTTKQVAAAVAAAPKITTIPSNLTPTLAKASANTATSVTPSLGNCMTGSTNLTLPCVFGDVNGRKTMVIWGDSHAEMWFTALNIIAKKEKWKLVALIELGCPVADVSVWNVGLNAPYPNCDAFRQNMINRINAMDPAVVVMSESAYTVSITGGTITLAQWKQGLETTLKALDSKNTKRVLIGNTIPVAYPVNCLSINPTNVQKCDGTDTTTYQQQRKADQQATAATKTQYINEIPWECSKVCTTIVGNMVVYFSAGHITATYSTYLSTVLRLALKPDL